MLLFAKRGEDKYQPNTACGSPAAQRRGHPAQQDKEQEVARKEQRLSAGCADRKLWLTAQGTARCVDADWAAVPCRCAVAPCRAIVEAMEVVLRAYVSHPTFIPDTAT